MKAIVYTKYGPPDVMQLQEVATPAPSDNEVLVKVHAASVNAADWFLVRGKPFLGRLMGQGVLAPRNRILGADIAGRVEAAGGNAKQFEPGADVFGDIGDYGLGAFAEYVSVPESALALKPANMTFEEAAAVPQAAVVALQGLRDRGKIQSGQRVLINGASGGIGTFAVQIARAFGAEVTGVCSTRNLDVVRSIGADEVIDYTREDFTRSQRRYDLIFDVVANRSIADYMRALSPRGRYVACAFNPTSLFLGPLISKVGSKTVGSLWHKPNSNDLVFMRELLEAGKVVPVINRRYPLNEVAEAVRYYGEGSPPGKIVITVENDRQRQSRPR